MSNNNKISPLHPGEVLLEEFLKLMDISQNKLALAIRVPARRINEIVHGRRRITADTALRLARFFGTSAHFWLGLQLDYDLDVVQDDVGTQIEQDVMFFEDVLSKPLTALRNKTNVPLHESETKSKDPVLELVGQFTSERALIDNIPVSEDPGLYLIAEAMGVETQERHAWEIAPNRYKQGENGMPVRLDSVK